MPGGLGAEPDLRAVRALVLDPRRDGSAEHRAAYLEELQARYADLSAAMDFVALPAAWVDRSEAWAESVLEVAAVLVYTLGELLGDYARLRTWGDRVLALASGGSVVRRAELMLRLSELHRVTGDHARNVELVHAAAASLGLPGLPPEEVHALAPVSCHALFGLGALAVVEGRYDDSRDLLGHAWTHGGDNEWHLWSLVNFSMAEFIEGRLDAALALDDAALAMAERLGDLRCLQACRNNRAVLLHHLGRHQEAFDAFAEVLPAILAEDNPDTVVTSAEDFACVLFGMGGDRVRDGAVLLGAAEAERASLAVPRVALQEAEIGPHVATARARLGADWAGLTARGAELGVLAAVAAALR